MIIFFLSVLLSQLAFADLDSALEKTIYSVVHEHCSSSDVNLEHSLAFVESMKGSFRAFNETISFNTTPAVQLYRDRGLSPATSTILDSMALHLALKSCYGENDNLKKQFVLKMITADLLGRTVGTVQGVISLFLGARIFAFLFKKAYQLLLVTPFGKNLSPAKAGALLGITGGSVTVGLLSPQFLELYYKKKTAEKRSSDDLKEYVELLEMAHTEMTRIQKLEIASCEKANETFGVAIIVQDIYKKLSQLKGAERTLKRFEALYQHSLQVQNCAS